MKTARAPVAATASEDQAGAQMRQIPSATSHRLIMATNSFDRGPLDLNLPEETISILFHTNTKRRERPP